MINYQGQKFIGNNVQILLEQLEIHGFRVPYSCRTGICGKCKIHLLAGKVKIMNFNKENCNDNIIPCCTCIPVTNLEIK